MNVCEINTNEDIDWQIDYDIEKGMYRVTLFENNHYCDEVIFNEYKNLKERNR